MIHLILGGARSGKSRFALAWANQRVLEHPVMQHKHFVATAEAMDTEMADRIQRHQRERGDDWQLAEVPLELANYLQQGVQQQGVQQPAVVLVDCLTLWLNNQLYHFPEQDFDALRTNLVAAVSQCQGDSKQDLVLVANEVGLGIVPMGEVSRVFVDQAGWLNQALAQVADNVTFVAAGLPMTLKGDACRHQGAVRDHSN